MSTHPSADGAALHRLKVEADADVNLLLRLLEPFVIHDVLPTRIASVADAAGLEVEIEFRASRALAERLAARLGVMVNVRRADLRILPARAAAA